MNKYKVLLIILLFLYSCSCDPKEYITKRFVVYYSNDTDTIIVPGCAVGFKSYRGTNEIYFITDGYNEVLSTTAIIKEIK